MAEWTLLLAAAVGTFALRASAVMLFGRVAMPDRVLRAIGHIGPAAVGALIAVAVAHPAHGARVAPGVFALAVAALVALRTRNIPLTLATGFGVLWLVS